MFKKRGKVLGGFIKKVLTLGKSCSKHYITFRIMYIVENHIHPHHLLPTGSEEREELWVGSTPVAKILSCQYMKTIALQLHKHEYSWVVKIRTTSEAVLRPHYTPWPLS